MDRINILEDGGHNTKCTFEEEKNVENFRRNELFLFDEVQ